MDLILVGTTRVNFIVRLVGQFFYYQARYLNSETIFVRMSAPEMSEMVPGLLKKDSERLAGREIKTT